MVSPELPTPDYPPDYPRHRITPAVRVDANIEPNIKQVTPGYKDFGG